MNLHPCTKWLVVNLDMLTFARESATERLSFAELNAEEICSGWGGLFNLKTQTVAFLRPYRFAIFIVHIENWE